MKLFQRFKTAVATRGVQFLASNANWDFQNSLTDRQRYPTKLVSTDTDLQADRERMMSDSRTLVQKFGIAKRILRQYANYTVGSCEVDFATGNPEWDEQAEEYTRDVFKMADASGRFSLRGLAKLGVKSKLRDGDIGFEKTKESDVPQLRVYEADRIRSSEHVGAYDTEKNVVGGIIIAGGRASSFRVWDRKQNYGFENKREIPAKNFLHLADPDRYDCWRPPTHFAGSSLNHMQDILEILNAEKKGVKVNSRFAMVVKRMAGGIPASGVNLFGPKNDRTGDQYTEEIPDGLIKYLLPGEEATSHTSNRPSAAWLGLMDFLIRDIAVSLDLPYSFVWNMAGLPGPAVRMESKQAERTFGHTTEILEYRLLDPYCAWVITDAMDTGRLPFNPFWYRYTFPKPSHPSIDVGRESVADLAEHERGWGSGQDYAGARGGNWFKNIRQKAREAKFVQDTAKEFGVPEDKLVSYGPKAVQADEDSDAGEEKNEKPTPPQKEEAPA